ncbi:MAG: CRISPR-associated helicase Cas3' [Candidatus Caldarchaeum sp.]
MSNIWAKSTEKAGGTPIRLSEHIEDVLKVFNELQGYVRDPHLSELIRLAIVFHDLGKVLPAFQIRTLKNKSYEPSYPYYNVPHSLFSVLWMDRDKLRERIRRHIKDSEKDQEDYLHFVLSAVAYHHWRENFVELLSPHNRELGDLCCELESKGYITRLQENLVEEIKKLNEDWHTLICFNNEMAKGLQNGVPFVEYARPPYQLYWLPKRVDIDESKLRDWILISGFLLRSDHFASFCEEEHEKYSPEHQGVNPAVLKENIKAKIGQTDENEIWQFQAIDQLKDKNVILVAPTGYGKTEFAFLWSNGEKFFYTLPLRAAVNQIYERASKVFKDNAGGKNSENVGLLHSDADVFLMGDGGEAQASMKAYDLARQLAFPAMISTGDQFFPYALRPPGYEKIYATFSYSRLVIDEVQAYDPRAAAIVVKFIEDVVRMGGKFLLMTATLPQFVQDEIDRLIGQSNYGQPKYRLLNMYQEGKDRFERLKKHHIKVELIENAADESKPDFTVPEDKLQEILKAAKEGKRVLVMANTVKQAQDIFDRLQELVDKGGDCASLKSKLWLLHSRFTQADRSELEAKLVEEFKNPKPNDENEGKILVATQVVEASLDIDADVLFTEIAPLDALVQRMGRVWRRYGPMKKPEEIPETANPNVYVWVFKHGLHSGQHYVYDNDLILLTLKLLLENKSDNQPNEDHKDWLAKKRKHYPKAEERIGAIVEEVFGSRESPQKKARARKRGKSKDASLGAASEPQGFQVTLSEYDKFALVEKLYDLPDDHSYLTKFRQTKDILDAGYMSDRLNDAQRMFREIYTVSVIPSREKNRFVRAVQEFFGKHRDGKRLYTLFKKQVLAKFVVTIPLNLKKLEGPNLQPVEWWVRGLTELDEKQRSQLLRWCQDIYFADYEYDPTKGIVVDALWDHSDAAII